MSDGDLTESIVRQHLRDLPGEARCAGCLARDLDLRPGGTLTRVLADLAERQPPFAPGRCPCGADGLMYVLR
jgi:hypothetical protein